ncbi:hypothetical protein LB505_010439 [Fusarium chuoi]|nr:hypothetical protein LB505_010439 [Fusarium chuoi]
MTLLPLSITGRRNTEKWTEPSSIVLLVVGVLTFVAFLIWDGRYAKKPIVPFRMIKNRNVILACASQFPTCRVESWWSCHWLGYSIRQAH